MITVGKYHGSLTAQARREMTYILIFDKVNEGDVNTGPGARLPHGSAMPLTIYYDLKRAFAFFMMMHDSLSLAEVQLMFGLDDAAFEDNCFIYDDKAIDHYDFPIKDKDRTKRSREKADLLTEALKNWKPLVPEVKKETLSRKILNMKEAEEELVKGNDEEDGNETESEDDDDDVVAVEKSPKKSTSRSPEADTVDGGAVGSKKKKTDLKTTGSKSKK